MRVIKTGISLPRDVLESLEEYMRLSGSKSRSKIIADALNQYLEERFALLGIKGEAVCAIIMLYDHTRGDTVKRVISAQHKHLSEAFFTTHMHLDERMCLEVIIARGDARELVRMAAELESIPGVEMVRIIPVRSSAGGGSLAGGGGD